VKSCREEVAAELEHWFDAHGCAPANLDTPPTEIIYLNGLQMVDRSIRWFGAGVTGAVGYRRALP
jgi:hypothetical protein